jgi:hypothetical protein
MIIKFFLIGSLVAASVWLMRGQRRGTRLALTRLAGIGFAASGVTGVIAPEAVTWVANRMGVGRGTDLVLYLLVVAFMFTTLAHQMRMREMGERLARLTRAHALLEVEVEGRRLVADEPHD